MGDMDDCNKKKDSEEEETKMTKTAAPSNLFAAMLSKARPFFNLPLNPQSTSIGQATPIQLEPLKALP